MEKNTFYPQYTIDLQTINQKLNSKNPKDVKEAIELFRTYTDKIINLGRFNPHTWDYAWRKEAYNFGEKFRNVDPVEFLKILDKETSDKDEQEILDFFKSEIKVNWQLPDYNKKKLKGYIRKYPNNPEFRHTLGIVYNKLEKYDKALKQFEFAIQKDKNSTTFLKTSYNAEYSLIERLIEEDKQEEAQAYCDEIRSKRKYSEIHEFNNLLHVLNQRIKDSLAIKTRLKDAQEEFKLTVRSETEKERRRLIEILSFFSAIIAFIFSTISIGTNYPLEESLIFLVVLGLVLILFLLIANILYTSENFDFRNSKTLLIIILVGSLFFILTRYTIPFWT